MLSKRAFWGDGEIAIQCQRSYPEFSLRDWTLISKRSHVADVKGIYLLMELCVEVSVGTPGLEHLDVDLVWR